MKNDFERTDNAVYTQVGDLLVKPKRKLGSDAILLIFICMLVLLTLTALTFLKFGVGSSVLTGELAFAEEEASGERIVSLGGAFGQESKAVIIEAGSDEAYQELTSSELGEEYRDFFFDDVISYGVDFKHDLDTNMVDIDYYDHDDEGNLIYNDLGDPVVLHYSQYWQPGSLVGATIDMDKALGLTADDTELEALEKFAGGPDNAAYAATWGPATTTQFSQNGTYTGASGLSASGSNSGGNGSGCDSYCSVYCELTGAQWKRWCNAWVCYAYASYTPNGSGSGHSYTGSQCGWWSSASYRNSSGDGNRNTWVNGASSPYRYFVTCHAHSNSTGSCSGSSTNCSISSCTIQFKHTNNSSLKWTATPNLSQSWATYRSANQVAYTAYSDPDYIRQFYIRWSRSESSWSYQQTGSTGSYNVSSQTLKNTNECYGNTYAYADDQAAHSISTSYSGAQLHIDRYAPIGTGNFWISTAANVNSGNLVQSGSSTTAAAKYVGSKTDTLYVFSTACDVQQWNVSYGYCSGASGLKRVWAYNDQNGTTVELSTDAGQYSGDYRYRRGTVQAQYANGRWYVYATDNVGNQRTLVSGYWINAVDCTGPVYESSNADGKFQVLASDTKNNAQQYWTTADTAWTGSIHWASAPLLCRIRFYDQTGCTYTGSSIYQRNGFGSIDIRFYYNGSLYVMTGGRTASGGNVNLTNVVGLSNTAEGGTTTPTQYCYFYFYLPFDMRNIRRSKDDPNATGMTITAYDKVGHSTAVTINDQTYKIDTVAPKVTAVATNYGKNANAYYSGNPVLTITAQDYANTSSSISGNTYCNNGSGLRRVFIYNVDPRSSRAASPLATLTTPTSGTAISATAAGTGAAYTFQWTVSGNWDSYNISGNATNKDPWFYVVAEDWAGNRSDAYNGYTQNTSLYTKNVNARNHNDTNYKSIQAPSASASYQWTNYYKTPDNTTSDGISAVRVYRDTVTPVVTLYSDANCTNMLCQSSNSGRLNYTFDWKNKNTTSVTFYAIVTCGSSGGYLKKILNSGNEENYGNQVQHYRTNGWSYSGSPGQATSPNAQKYAITVSSPGENTTKIRFLSGASKTSSTVSITTRLDTAAPVPTLVGFSTSMRDNSNISGTMDASEATLATTWTAKSYYAVFKITDQYSGLTNSTTATKSYGINGNSVAQTTQSKFTFNFWYEYTDAGNVKHRYEYSKTDKLSYIGSNYYVQMKMFDLNDLQNLRLNNVSSNRTFLSGGAWDIKTGTYLHYSFTVYDFAGNVTTYASKDCVGASASSPKTDLVYRADPFPIGATVKQYTVAESNFESVVTRTNGAISTIKYNDTTKSKFTGYKGDWTKDMVLIQTQITPGLSPTSSVFGYKINGASTFKYTNHSDVGVNASPIAGAVANEEWFYFPTGTRNLLSSVKVSSATTSKEINTSSPVAPWNISGPIEIKQDITAPVLSAAFFSTDSSITAASSTSRANNNILLYYDLIGGNFYLNTKASNPNINLTDGFTWSDSKTYLYVVVSDATGGSGVFANMNGSGICDSNLVEHDQAKVNAEYYNITYSSSSDSKGTATKTTTRMTPVACINASTYTYLYRTTDRFYGYESKQDASTANISFSDMLGNTTTLVNKLGGTTASGTNSKSGTAAPAYKMLPIVDTVQPVLKLKSTGNVSFAPEDKTPIAGQGKTSSSYTRNVNNSNKLHGTLMDTNGSTTKYSDSTIGLNGNTIQYFISADSLQLNFDITVGISGYKIYLRRRDFDTKLSSQTSGTNKLYTELFTDTKNNVLPDGYDFAAEGWGYYNATTQIWTPSATTSWVSTTSDIADSDRKVVKTLTNSSCVIRGSTVKNRFDMLLVNGMGKYYLIEMGDVSMDTSAPEFYDNATFFSVAKDTDEVSGGVLDFNNIRRDTAGKSLIWSNVVGSDYTNGEVYAYFRIEDKGIGVDDATVKVGTSRLAKVTVNNLRVLKLGSTLTKVLWFDDYYSSIKEIGNENGFYYVVFDNNVKAVTDIEFGTLSIFGFTINSNSTIEMKIGSQKKTVTNSTSGFDFHQYSIKKIRVSGGKSIVTFLKNNTTSTTYEATVDIPFAANIGAAAATSPTSVTYYRYQATDSSTVQPKAADKLAKEMLSVDDGSGRKVTPIYSPKIDRTNVDLKVNMFYYQDSNNDETATRQSYKGKNGSDEIFSRTDIDFEIDVTYGISGFGIFSMQITDLQNSSGDSSSQTTLPVLAKNGSKLNFSYYAAGGTWTTIATNFVYKDTNTVKTTVKSGNNVWVINDNITDYVVDQTYYAAMVDKKLTVDITLGQTTLAKVKFTLDHSDSNNNGKNNNFKRRYDFHFENQVSVKSTRTATGHEAAITEMDNNKFAYMDTKKPELDKTKGTWSTIASSASYNRIGKLLSVKITDALSGMAKAAEYENLFDKVKVSWKQPVYNDDGTVKRYDSKSAWMLNDYYYNGSADGLYRPTLYNGENSIYDMDNKTIRRNGFMYCDYAVEYTIEAWDKAGNKMTEKLTPNIDNVKSEITSLTFQTGSGSSWSAYTPGTWTSKAVRIIGEAVYGGSSGYVLQCRMQNTDSFTWSDWVTLSDTAYAHSETVDNGRRHLTFTITIGEGEAANFAFFKYYELRILSGAEQYELNLAYSSSGITPDNSGRELKIKRTVFVDSDTANAVETNVPFLKTSVNCYCIGDVVKRFDLDGEHEVAEGNSKGVRIDMVTPSITATAISNTKAYGTKVESNKTITGGDFVNSAVAITVSSTQTATPAELNYASGTFFYYSTIVGLTAADRNQKSKWVRVIPGGSFGSEITLTKKEQAITKSAYAVNMVYTIDSDQPGTSYAFFIESGAGKQSDIFYVNDICIDKKTPTVSVSAVDSYQEFAMAANGLFPQTNAAAFENVTVYKTATYNQTQSGSVWTKKNSVILKIEIGNVGYSGATLKILSNLKQVGTYSPEESGEVTYKSLSYNTFITERDTSNDKYVMYIAIPKNGDRRLDLTVYENATKNGTTDDQNKSKTSSYIKLDNTTPILNVSSITSANVKAKNWNYAASGDKWYVNAVTISFSVGFVEKENGEYVYNSGAPYSGYKIYVCKNPVLNGNKWTYNWDSQSLSDNRYVLSGYLAQETCVFKIVSTAGMEYILGQSVYDSSAEGNAISTIKYADRNYVRSVDGSVTKYQYTNGTQKTVLHAALGGVTGHNVDGNKDETFTYVFNVDTNVYTYSHEARLAVTWAEKEEDRVYNKIESDMVSYVIQKGDWSNETGGVFTAVPEGGTITYKHGDIIKVSYVSKANQVLSNTYNNYHISTGVYQTKQDVNGATIIDKDKPVVTHGNAEANMGEDSGFFTVVFGNANVKSIADFGAELRVAYGATTFYMQYKKATDPLKTTGSVVYYYGTDDNLTHVEPDVLYKYYELELDSFGHKVYTGRKVSDVTDVGAYYVVPYLSMYKVYTATVGERLVNSGVVVYEKDNDDNYFLSTDDSFLENKVYYIRNSTGNFRVAIHDEDSDFLEYTSASDNVEISSVNFTVYEKGSDGVYFRTNDTVFHKSTALNKKYYRRVADTTAIEERQEFVVKYFSNSKSEQYYYVDNLVDFTHIDDSYYNYDATTDELTLCSYLVDVGARKYQLTSDLQLTANTFNGLRGRFQAIFEGQNHTISLNALATVTSSFGIFDEFAGTLTDLNIVVIDPKGLIVSANGSENIYVGLIAEKMFDGVLENVSVTADITVTSSEIFTGILYVGGIAATAQRVGDYGTAVGSDGKPVFTDIRVKNNGVTLKNAYIGGMFAYVTDVRLRNAIAFGDVTIYNADSSVSVGMVAAGGLIATSSVKYFKNNTFLNDSVVSTLGVGFTGGIGSGLTYDSFVTPSSESGVELDTKLGDTSVAGLSIAERILTRLYTDFKFTKTSDYKKGLGTTYKPLQITEASEIAVIDSYVNLHYRVMNDIDVSGVNTIALHKVFNGSFGTFISDNADANSVYRILSGFGSGVTNYTDKFFGFFGQLNGTVHNIVFNGLDIDMRYTGSGELMAGIVAGKTYTAANINNVFTVGITKITASGSQTVNVGGIVGRADGSTIADVLNMNNITVIATNMNVGGIVGRAGVYVSPIDDNAVKIAVSANDSATFAYSLGRVEVNTPPGQSAKNNSTGAILGKGDMHTSSGGSSVFALLDNTYSLGQVTSEKSIGNGNNLNSVIRMTSFDSEDMRSTSLANGLSAFELLFGTKPAGQAQWYPISGKGMVNDPFRVVSESDFKNINLALFAYYKLIGDSNGEIRFTDFETIGDGLNFTGTIDGAGDENVNAEDARIVSLINVTKPLVYNVKGTVQNIGLTVNYTHVISEGETLRYGAVAVYLETGGSIKNITIGGTVNVTGSDYSTKAYVSGFVAIARGGSIDNANTKIKNNISALEVRIKHVGTVYFGGYAASVEQGEPSFSYGLANGEVFIEDCPEAQVSYGFLVGESYGVCHWSLDLSSDYFYKITIITNGNQVQVPKPDDDDTDEEKARKLIGKQN